MQNDVARDIARSLRSIAESMEKLANPLLEVKGQEPRVDWPPQPRSTHLFVKPSHGFDRCVACDRPAASHEGALPSSTSHWS